MVVLRALADIRSLYIFRASFMVASLAPSSRTPLHNRSGQHKDQATNHGRSPTQDLVVSEPNHSILFTKRSIWSCPIPKWNRIHIQKRRLHTDCEDTKSDDKTSQVECRKTYRSRYGEEIVFTPCDPPPGFVFVPSGNGFITGRCRKLARNLFVVYRSRSRKKRTARIGLYVPKDVFGKVQREFKAKRASLEKWLWQDLEKRYPRIPPTDKAALHRLVLLRYPIITGRAALRHTEATVCAYIRDRYTAFKRPAIHGENRDTEAIARVEERLAAWRGEGLVEKESSKSREIMEKR